MRIAKALFIVALFLPLSMASSNAGSGRTDVRDRAMELYSEGMYDRARTLFESVPDDPLCEGYALLCAIRRRMPDCEYLLRKYFGHNSTSILVDEICYRHGANLFDDGDYAAAGTWLGRAKAKNLASGEQAAFAFKQGWCAFSQGNYFEARSHFMDVESMEMSEFKAPARYSMGYMAYIDRNFKESAKWFDLSVTDPRFEALSRFYLVDCHFMEKDYDYVISNGEAIFDSAPEPRQKHLARLISESYLVKGDKEMAREFYSRSSTDKMTRSDFFYAGSVLYAVEDYTGAIENYEKMTERSDSLGQIANYQLGNSYVRTRNKVAAMNAFKAASQTSFNTDMQEDAWFNYAKLAFDINKDTSGFTSYIKRYNTSRKGDQIYGYMALAMLTDHDYAGAVDAYDHIDELDADQHSNYIKAYYLRAEQLVSSGSYTDAVPYLKAAAYYLPKQDKLNQLSRYWQAECNYKTEKYADAAAIYADLYNISALNGEPEGSRIPYNAAYSHFLDGDYDSAARWFDIYLNEGSTDLKADAAVRRADCDFARKMYDEAAVSYGKAIDESDISKDLYPVYQQGLSYGLAGDKRAKVAALSAVARVSPEASLYGDTMYELGKAYMDIKDNNMAVETFETLSASTTDTNAEARALIGLGMVYRNMKDYDKSLESYKSVVRKMPDTEYAQDALLAIESIYQTRKQPQKYLEYIEQNRLDADKSEAAKEDMYFNTAEQVYMSGDWVQAVASVQKYLDSYPDGSRKSDAYFYMAESYKGMGNKEKAVEYYKMVFDSPNPGSFIESATLNYSDLCYGMERFADSYDGYTRLLDIARFDSNKLNAKVGRLRSAYKARRYEDALSAAAELGVSSGMSVDVQREVSYMEAKSCLATSRREEGLEIFRTLSKKPATPEGAEARYILVQDAFNRGDFESVRDQVFDFSDKSGDQSYWLAKSYITLADSFAETGKKDQARATYESIRDGYTPSGPEDDILNILNSKMSKLESL